MNDSKLTLQNPIGLAVVTGANGHLGANLVRVLLAQGVPVRAVVRPGKPHPALNGLPIDIREHDVLEPNDWTPILNGCTHLFHCAALFAFQPDLHNQILATAVEGTRHLFNAAKKCDTLERIIYTSSTAAIGYTYSPKDFLTETDWNEKPDNSYIEAKLTSERLAWQIASEAKLPLIVVNPSVILGYYNYRITPSMQMLLQPLIRTLPISIAGGLTVVDATDCATGHVLAADRGKVGERYVLCGESLFVTDFYRIIAELTGVAPPRYKLGKTTGTALAMLLETSSWLTKKPSLITRKRFTELYGRYGYYSADKAIKELDFQPKPARETITRAIAWLIIGNAIPLQKLQKMRLGEEITHLLPFGWKPGKTIQLQTYSNII